MTYTITYSGKGVSWNDIYGSSGKNAWKVRKTIVDKYKKIFTYLILEAKLPWIDTFKITLFYNSRLDPDNCGANLKMMLDALKQDRLEGKVLKQGWIYDDSKKFCKGVSIIPDESLPTDTYKFVIEC
jgi:hypothetical protein